MEYTNNNYNLMARITSEYVEVAILRARPVEFLTLLGRNFGFFFFTKIFIKFTLFLLIGDGIISVCIKIEHAHQLNIIIFLFGRCNIAKLRISRRWNLLIRIFDRYVFNNVHVRFLCKKLEGAKLYHYTFNHVAAADWWWVTKQQWAIAW